MGDEQNLFGEIAGKTGGTVETRRGVNHDVMKHADDHVEQTGEVGCGGLDGNGGRDSREHLQSAIVADHETVEQGCIEAVEVGEGVGRW